MKILFFLLILFLIDQCCGRCTPAQAQAIISRRISEKKCEEYKDLIAETYFVGGLPLYLQGCNTRGNKVYKCNPFTGLIVGGEKTKPGEFPHMAAIGWEKDGKVAFMCGGSLISDRFVLTVAHCAYDDESVAPSVVRLGDQNLGKSNDGAQPVSYKVKSVIKHEKYSPNTKENDIALIKLDKIVQFNKLFIRPACLYQDDTFNGVVVATGWGKTSTFSNTSDELLKVSLNTVDSDSCYEKIEDESEADKIFPSQICAGGERNKDTCQGDSGGPIQVSHSDALCVYNVVGLTSYGSFKCGDKTPAVYTRVSRYLDWIEQNVWPNQ